MPALGSLYLPSKELRTGILFCFRFSLFEGFMMSWLSGSWDSQINMLLLKMASCLYLFLLGAR